MKTLLTAIVIVGLWIWARSPKKQQEEMRELRRFEHWQRLADDFTLVWRLDYVEMCLRISTWTDHDVPDDTYHVRRSSPSHWETRLSDESFDREVQAIKKRMAEPKRLCGTLEGDKEELDELGTAPKWKPVRDELVGPIESQYQRFLRHWRES